MAVWKCIQSHIACNLHMSSQNLIPIHHPQLDTRTSQSILIICNFPWPAFLFSFNSNLSFYTASVVVRWFLPWAWSNTVGDLGRTQRGDKHSTASWKSPCTCIQSIGNSLHSSLGNKTHFKRLPRLLPIPRPCKL